MNIQDYISSGILEAYVLGELSREEQASVEKMLAEHAELRTELARIEETLEAFAMKASVAPRAALKDKIMSSVKTETAQQTTGKPEGKILPLNAPDSSPTAFWKYATAASIAVALTTSYFAFDYRSRWIEKDIAFNELTAQNQRIAEDYNVVNQKLDKIQGDLGIIESTAFQKVVMSGAGTPNPSNALASVYWNASTKEVYLSIQNLKEISKDNQFQLWAIVDGKPVDAGVFDKNFAGLLKMKSITGASAFAVTIEPRGGLPAPTLGTMQVVGAIPATKS